MPIACSETIPWCWQNLPATSSTGSTRPRSAAWPRIRTSLSEYVEPDVVAAATEAWLEQGARLARTRRSVTLLAEALRGRVFVRKL